MFLRAVGNYLGNATTSMIRGLVEPGYFAQQKALRKLGFRDDKPVVFKTLNGRIFQVGVSRYGKRFEAYFGDSGNVTLITVTHGHFPIYPGHDGTREKPMTQFEAAQFRCILLSELSPELKDELLPFLYYGKSN